VQVRPAIRLYKLACALGRSHEIVVALGAGRQVRREHGWMAERFEHVEVETVGDVESLAASTDAVVHCDVTRPLALAGRRHPGYVKFVGDVVGIREDADRSAAREAVCLRAARGQIFTSPVQASCAQELYGPFACPVLALHNGPVEEMLRRSTEVAKLSAADGRIHVVYAGAIAGVSGTSRDVRPLIEALLGEDDLVVHVIGAASKKVPDWVRAHGRAGKLVVDPTVSSRDLVGSLSRFDAGLVYYHDAFPRIRDTTRPNKVYEYLAAGLPVVANRGRAVGEYLAARRAGVLFDRVEEVPAAVRRAVELPRRAGWPPPVETYEAQLPLLEAFFADVLAGRQSLRGS
jgi:glycosyltransferase involved in cell wall biosynthesis